jgi:hypothetical protein
MPTASFNKTDAFRETLVEGVNAGTDTWKILLSNTAPTSSSTNTASITQIGSGTGYTTGGNTAAVSTSAQSAGVYKLVLSSPTAWTASGAGFTVRYAVLVDSTADSVAGWWDYGSSQAVAAGETFTVTLDGTNGVFQVT